MWFILVSLSFSSCTKENVAARLGAPGEAMVKTRTEGDVTETYYYDGQKRVVKITYTSSSAPAYYHEFTYTAKAVSEYHSEEPTYALEQTLPNGVTKLNCSSNPVIYPLNEKGYFTGLNTTCQSQNLGYSKEGFLAAEDFSITDYSVKLQYTNNGKDILKTEGKGFSYGGGEFGTSTTYTYYNQVSTIGNKNFGKSFLGKSSESLVNTMTKDGVLTTYAYAFDTQQRVIQQTISSGSTQKTIRYTYY